MAKRRSLLGGLIKWLLGIILTVALILGAIYAFVYFKYNINLIDIFRYVGTVNESVDTTKLVTNPYTEDDLTSAKGKIDDVSIFDSEITFTDREVGAYIFDSIANQTDGIKVTIAGKELDINDLDFKLHQVLFSDIPESLEGNGVMAKVNVVISIDISSLKEDYLSNFPFTIIKNYIPNTFYISATVDVLNYDDENPENEYSVNGVSATVNNLTKDQTSDILRMINNFVDIGTIEDLAKIIGEPIVNALIGNETNTGIAYELMQKGALGYRFTTDGTNNYFSIYK